ncbi:hypothetical protein [Streptomyces jumonjinensis]|uniref:hypothetical protein n=1 Tax=Streptomyces jumonjinensis TaxID=1945 RepID=UPI0037B4F0E8
MIPEPSWGRRFLTGCAHPIKCFRNGHDWAVETTGFGLSSLFIGLTGFLAIAAWVGSLTVQYGLMP